MQVVASVVLSISAEIAASKTRLEEVLARLDVAEKTAKDRENYICKQNAELPMSNYFQGRKIQFEDAFDEEEDTNYNHQLYQVFSLIFIFISMIYNLNHNIPGLDVLSPFNNPV